MGPTRYRVKVLPDLDDGADGDVVGLSHRDIAEVHLIEGMAQDAAREVLLHELLHALDHTYGIPLPEKTVARLSPALLALLRHNRHLVAYLTAERGKYER